MTDYNGAQWISNNNFFLNRNGYKPSYIVLHGTGGGTTAQATASYFQSTQGTSNPVSSHYIVGIDGAVVQCVMERDGAWANGYISGQSGTSGDGIGNGYHDSWWDSGINPNNLTISIEHVKSATDNSSQLTDVQKQASFKLIRDICQRNNIPARKADANGGITGHYAIDPVNRAECPGPYPWDELFTFLQQGDTSVLDISQVSGYFTETVKDQRWHCKQTNIDIAYGILTYYRTCTQVGLNGFSQYGLPTSAELALTNVKGATFQRFERGVIVFDPTHADDSVPGIVGPCYPGHLDRYALATPGQVNAVIGDLQTIQAAIGNAITVLKG